MNVFWRRSVKFYEHRYEVLRAVEEMDILHQFQVEQDQVSLRLGDANHTVAFSSTWLEAALLQPEGDQARVRAAFQLIFERLQPERLVRPVFSFQWLVGLDLDYDRARRDAATALIGSAAASFTDFALLSDGQLEQERLSFRLEVGIVEAAEAPYRLARAGGQIVQVAPTEHVQVPPSLWPIDSLPKVAFFCDSVWEPSAAVAASADDLLGLWGQTAETAERVMSGLLAQTGLGEEISDE